VYGNTRQQKKESRLVKTVGFSFNILFCSVKDLTVGIHTYQQDKLFAAKILNLCKNVYSHLFYWSTRS